MIPKLKVLIDPFLKEKYGPEICWTWRLLLSSLGYSWEEVPSKCSECDIAYVTDLKNHRQCKVRVHAEMENWDQNCSLLLEEIRRSDDLSYPVFKGKPSPQPAFILNDGRTVCNRDIIFDVFWLVTAQEEKHCAKNKHGFFDLSGNALLKNRVFASALASNIGSWLEKRLLSLGFSFPLARWPANKQAAACLSHDVDYPEVKRLVEPLRIIRRQGLKGLRPAVAVLIGTKDHWHFSSWIEMEKRLGLRSAFYFATVQGSVLRFLLGTPDPFYDVTSEPFGQVFKYLVHEGFEIGLHSSYFAFTSAEKFGEEKETLQRIAGQEILGNRHHYWHLNPEDIESTLLLHEQIGLRYDSSLGHERYIGWRNAISWPFFPFLQKQRRELKTLQVPPAWMDNQLFGHLDHNPGDPRETLQAVIDNAAKQGGCMVVDIHNYVFDDALFPGWRNTYFWLVQNLIDRSDFWIGTPGEIANHWIQRYNSIVHESNGLEDGS
jgi:hypothetical protein